MYTRYYSKNSDYLLSKRNYLCDYSKIASKRIDMTMSGRFLAKYPTITIPISEFDKYPLHTHIDELSNLIKTRIKTKCEIVIGSGANGILQNIVKLLFMKKGNLVTSYYSFDQVEYAVTSFGSTTKRVFTNKYQTNLDNILKAVDSETRMIYLSNPNNPTGQFINPKTLIAFANKVKVPVVIDESGIEFSNHAGILELIKKLPDNLLVVRSFSKAYGLANLRIGYLGCNQEFQKLYLENTTTNEYSGISCIIAKTMLLNYATSIKKNVKNIIKEREYLINSLSNIGINVINSNANIIFTKTIFSNDLLNVLDENDVSVVPIYDKDNYLHIRIAVQDHETNRKFVAIMKKIITNKELIVGINKD